MLLDQSKFIIKSKARTLSAKKDFEIVDFDSGAALGSATDVTGFFPSILGAAKIEVRDFSNNELAFIISRTGFLFKKDMILDAKEQPIGQIKSKKFSLSGGFHIYDKDGKHISEIQGSMFKAEYTFVTPDRATQMGKVSRTWGGLAKSLLTGDSSYGVQIDPALAGNLPVKMLVLGTAIALESILKPAKAESGGGGGSSGGGGEE